MPDEGGGGLCPPSHPVFDRSVDPIPARGAYYAHFITTSPPPQIFDQYGVSDRARYVTTHSNRAGGTGVAGVAFATLIFGRYIHPIPIGGGEAESALLLLYY